MLVWVKINDASSMGLVQLNIAIFGSIPFDRLAQTEMKLKTLLRSCLESASQKHERKNCSFRNDWEVREERSFSLLFDLGGVSDEFPDKMDNIQFFTCRESRKNLPTKIPFMAKNALFFKQIFVAVGRRLSHPNLGHQLTILLTDFQYRFCHSKILAVLRSSEQKQPM